MAHPLNNDKEYSFPQKVWLAGGILALIVVFLLLLKATFSVLLLVLAGTLIAVFFRALSGIIQRMTKWKEGICLLITILGTLVVIVLLFWMMGSKVQSQMSQLAETLPVTVENAKQQLNKSPIGQKIVEQLASPDSQQKATSLVQTIFNSTFGIIGDLYVILFIGIFFTVSPRIYTSGFIQLVPIEGRGKANNILAKLGRNLKKWLKGKLFAMLIVFVLTSIGLVVIGMPMWLALALIAGILNFIPNFGPLLALIPAVLVGLILGPSTAIWVAGLYIVVQLLESNFITPMVQQRLINIPPAMIIIAQLLIAPFTGVWGLALATPLLVIIVVLVKELYISKQ
jgi:predicted PurR-regulated permease PerM